MVDEMKIYNVTDPEFAIYGKCLDLDCSELIATASTIAMPAEGSRYEAAIDSLEQVAVVDTIQNVVYGEMPIQVGYCWGHNNALAALEWHKSSELNIATTDFVLLLGKLEHMQDNRFDSRHIKAFRVRKGEAVEIYATTLHFCPCSDDPAGFGCIVVLPKGTNIPLDAQSADPLLFRKNKWIICRDESESLRARGVATGLF